MKIDSTDFPKIQASLIAVVLMMLVGAATVYAALNATKTAKLNQTTAQAQRNELDRKLKRVSSEENEIKQDAALFNTLQARGVVGEEKRLDWVELLKTIRDKRRLIDLQYEISTQRPLDTTLSSGFAYFASTMKIQLKLLHEEDLTRLLDDLRQQASALTQVKSCNVSRLPRDVTERGTRAQLQAECQIDWVTLRETGSK